MCLALSIGIENGKLRTSDVRISNSRADIHAAAHRSRLSFFAFLPTESYRGRQQEILLDGPIAI
jgi:hypothetical protein